MSRTAVALVVALTASAGCSDPVVSVQVVVPTEPRDYAAALASIAISVLAPEDDAFDCDAIAFGELDGDTIALAEVAGVTLTLDARSAGGIAGVPRLGRKLWVAEGRNPMGLPVIAGCTEQGDIEDDTTVVIVAEPSGQLLVDPHRADLPLPAELGVSLDGGALDPSGAKVVRWQLTDGGDRPELREVWRDDALGPPASIALGNLDGDDQPDTVWGLLDAVQGGLPESRLQVSLGCGAGDLSLNSITAPLSSPGAAVFLASQTDLAADVVVGTSRQALFFDIAEGP